MKRISSAAISIRLRPGQTRISLNLTWLVVMPVGLWVVATFYVPIFGAFLSVTQTWTVTFLIAAAIAVSLLGHALAHSLAALRVGSNTPATVSLFLFGDAAQAWPTSMSARREAAAAQAGPLFNLVLAG